MIEITPPQLIKAKRNNRRYRLHAKVKYFTSINGRSKSVFVTEALLSSITPEQLKVITELRDVFKYNIQFEIR